MDPYYDPFAGPRLARHLCLTGFCGSGLDQVAHRFASLTGNRSVVLRDLLTHRRGNTPAVLWHKLGEQAYRAAEAEALMHALHDPIPAVISLDEGTLTHPDSARLVETSADLVYIEYSLEALVGRIRDRQRLDPTRYLPWLAFDVPDEQIAHRFGERQATYRRAPLHLDADHRGDSVLATLLEQSYARVN